MRAFGSLCLGVMSPYMLSVTITSKCSGCITSAWAAAST